MAVLPPDPVFSLRVAGNTPVHSLAYHFLPGGLERLVAGCGDGMVHAYNLQTNRLQQKVHVGHSPILNLHHADFTLFTQEKGGIIKIFKLAEGGYIPEKTINIDHTGFCRFQVCNKLERLYVPVHNSTINILDYSGKKIASLKPEMDDKFGETMCFKQFEVLDNPYLLSGYESGDMVMWDLKSNCVVASIKLKECPMSLDLDLNTLRGIWAGVSDIVQVFTLSRKDLTLSHKGDISIKNAGVNRVKSREDGKVFVTAGWDGRLRIFSWKTLRPLAVLSEHRGAVQDVVYSECKVSMWKATIMAAGGLDGQITLWDLYK